MTNQVAPPSARATPPDEPGPVPGRPLSVLLGLEGLALGGCPINALDLGRTLRGRGHRVEVFAIDEQVRTSLLPYAERSGFRPTLLPQRSSTHARARQIRRLMDASSSDVVHVFGPWLGRAATIAAAGRRPRSAVVTNWMMENVPYVPRRTPLVLGTRRLRDEAEGIQGRKVWLMEPPVDLEADAHDAAAGRRFRRELGVTDDEIAVVVVGRVDAHLKEEGLRHAIEAVVRLGHPALRLLVVGDGDAFDRIQSEADRANRQLGRRAVVLTGSRQDPRPAYDAADIALGMGGSALRALAHARPLVVLGQHGFAATYGPETRAYFDEQGFFGDTSEADPAGHLAAQLVDLLDPSRRAELAAYGRAEVQRYGLRAGAVQLEALYREELGALPGVLGREVDAALLSARAFVHETRFAARGWSGARPARQP